MSTEDNNNNDELVTSHSDENPELEAGDHNALCAYTTEGSAVSQLYENDKKGRKPKNLLGVTEEEAQHLLEYEDHEGNYYYYD